jgi:polyhydroxyalkanoate synthesis regulator phasin
MNEQEAQQAVADYLQHIIKKQKTVGNHKDFQLGWLIADLEYILMTGSADTLIKKIQSLNEKQQ